MNWEPEAIQTFLTLNQHASMPELLQTMCAGKPTFLASKWEQYCVSTAKFLSRPPNTIEFVEYETRGHGRGLREQDREEREATMLSSSWWRGGRMQTKG